MNKAQKKIDIEVIKDKIQNLIYSANTLNMLEKLALSESIFALLEEEKSFQTLIDELNAKLEVAAINRKKQIGEFNSNPEWYTPPKFIEMARSVMGTIDTDPASNEIAQEWIKAKKYYTKQNNGYCQNWTGNVWCNPPYGRDVRSAYGDKKNIPVAYYWLSKGIQLYRDKKINQILFLVNRTEASWYKDLTVNFNAICEVTKRIAFFDSKGKPSKSARYYNDFLYLGNNCQKFDCVFGEIGRVTV